MCSSGLPVIFHDAHNTSPPFTPHVFTFNSCMSSTYLSHSSGFLSAVPLQQVGCQTVLLTPDRLSNIDLSGNCYESTVKIKLKRLDRGGGDISIKHVHLPAMISMKNSSDVQKQSRRVQETQRVLCVQIEEEAGAHRKSLAGSRLIRDGNPMQIMSGNLSRKWEKG